MTTQRQTLEQQRAASAWEQIMAVERNTGPEDKQRKKYGTLARKLPAMIQINGLGTALAFLCAKGKNKKDDGHTLIFNHLSAWVLHQLQQSRYQDLLDFVRSAETEEYRRATAEAIEYAIWLRRYVEAKDWGSATGDDE